MLVLSRKEGQRLKIGDEITVTVIRVGPNVVRIGIDAPKALNIVREEINWQPQKNQPAQAEAAVPNC